VRADDKRLRAGTDATDAAWFALTDLPRLAFDHPVIIDDARTTLRRLSDTGDIALNLMPESFTMTELLVAHEKIIGGECYRRNFSKRILDLDVVEPTGEKRTGPHRPAATYRRKKQ
ncbi:MAG: NUDIX hydrolase, partial [Marivivens sp.]|nr:NUDIX hydrolase [Marivivens sp.]